MWDDHRKIQPTTLVTSSAGLSVKERLNFCAMQEDKANLDNIKREEGGKRFLACDKWRVETEPTSVTK